jgi:hypothetical protein
MLTDKQKGNAGEMIVAAEIALTGGIPAFLIPADWPSYDVIAQPAGACRLRISVKTRGYARSGNFVGWAETAEFDWLAIVILPGVGFERRRVFMLPYDVAMRRSYYTEYRRGRGFFVHRLIEWPNGDGTAAGGNGVADFEDNYRLDVTPRMQIATAV